MTSKQIFKNYYQILGIPENASLFEIENAYEKLAAQWHPDKNKEHRKSAEAKFHDINEAFEVLSDRNKRVHYDELLLQQYSEQDAGKTFERFFSEHGMVDEEEEKFFNTFYPDPLSSYYQILGIPRNATFDEIKDAYRKKSLKYHPKSNQNNPDAKKKFLEVSEAYNALSNQLKRQTYDNLLYNEMVPVRAHNIFEDWFGNRLFNWEEDDFLKPVLHNKWSKDLDKMMVDDDDKDIKNGEKIKSSTVYSNDNGVEKKKIVTTKKAIKDGKLTEETTEEYFFPSGEKKVIKTTNKDGKIESNQYLLKAGEQLPKQLTN